MRFVLEYEGPAWNWRFIAKRFPLGHALDGPAGRKWERGQVCGPFGSISWKYQRLFTALHPERLVSLRHL